MTAASFGHRHPLAVLVESLRLERIDLTNVELVPGRKGQYLVGNWRHEKNVSAPVVVYCLDDEAEGGADAVDVLAHYLFDNRGFARIVEAPASWSAPCDYN